MRISKVLLAGLVLAACAGPVSAGGEARLSQAQTAFDRGIESYKEGRYDLAIRGLNEVLDTGTERDKFFARFYLARIYSDNAGPTTNHGLAYQLFEQVVVTAGDIDPDDGRRAPFVSKSLIALAGYLRTGLPMIGLKPDVERADDYLQDAATVYNDKDAQFELAKVQLGSDAGPKEIKLGVHYLSVLTKEGHPGAQAYLADLYWRGRYVEQDSLRAMALVKIAIENAPAQERVWIEDIYQNIYCGAPASVRKQADSTVAAWRKVFARPPVSPEERAAVAHMPTMARFCKGGEVVDLGTAMKTSPDVGVLSAPSSAFVPAPPAMQGNISGFGIIGAGVKN
jgi:TPR repeat protein